VRALWLLTWLLLCASVAFAQPQQSVHKQAEASARFEEAMKLMHQRKFERACTLLEESLALAADMTTAFRLAECYDELGKAGPAWHYYREVAEAAEGAGLAERRDHARKLADRLTPKLARLRIVVPDDAQKLEGLTIAIDGRVTSVWNEEVRVDPGTHEITASAPDHHPWSQTVELVSRKDTAEVKVELRRIPPPPPPPTPAPPEKKMWVPPLEIGIALTSVGAAGVVTGLVIGGIAKGRHDDSLEHCADRACTDEGLAIQDEAIAEGNAATVVFSIGLAALAAGAGFWLASELMDDSVEVGLDGFRLYF